jgi:hypothetical protein
MLPPPWRQTWRPIWPVFSSVRPKRGRNAGTGFHLDVAAALSCKPVVDRWHLDRSLEHLLPVELEFQLWDFPLGQETKSPLGNRNGL